MFAYNYLAKNINYKKKDGTIINVEEALNELYKEKNTFEHYAQIPSGTTINVNKGDYIIAISVNPITATNS